MQLVSPATTNPSASSARLIAFAAMVIFLSAMLGILLRPIGYLSIFWPANQLLLVLLLRYPRQLLQPVLPQAGAAAPLAIDALAGQLATASPFGLAALIGTRP